MKIHIPTSDRLLFVGKTGSGKTELARFFLMRTNRVLVIDPKHMFELDGFEVRKSLPFVDDDFRIIFRPNEDDDLELAQLIGKLQRARDCTIYCDELSTLADQFPVSTDRLGNLARIGRQLKVSVWNSVQRPRWIPKIFLTESEIIFQFNLRSGDDRRLMSEFVGAEALDPLKGFDFWYSNTREPEPIKMRLDLTKRAIISA